MGSCFWQQHSILNSQSQSLCEQKADILTIASYQRIRCKLTFYLLHLFKDSFLAKSPPFAGANLTMRLKQLYAFLIAAKLFAKCVFEQLKQSKRLSFIQLLMLMLQKDGNESSAQKPIQDKTKSKKRQYEKICVTTPVYRETCRLPLLTSWRKYYNPGCLYLLYFQSRTHHFSLQR